MSLFFLFLLYYLSMNYMNKMAIFMASLLYQPNANAKIEEEKCLHGVRKQHILTHILTHTTLAVLSNVEKSQMRKSKLFATDRPFYWPAIPTELQK